jgi:anhydro-N-acetylmuramic acid kinase
MPFTPDKNRYTALGLMSGTSMDAIEVALVHFTGRGMDTRVEFAGHLAASYPPALKSQLLMAVAGNLDIPALVRLDKAVAEAFAGAALYYLQEHKLTADSIDFIGSHGQTIGHWPGPAPSGEYQVTASCQLGDGSVIAARTGILTVCDFRGADMAAGGQGAPLVPYFDYLLYRHQHRGRVLLNLGGIANITVLPAQTPLTGVIGFDTGPANCLSDALAVRLSGGKLNCDEGGKQALAGHFSGPLLSALLQHPFLAQPPPKSVDRSVFGEVLANYMMTHRGAFSDADLLATAAEFTVESIVQSLEKFVFPEHMIEELIVSGGGVHNGYLMRGLQNRLPGTAISLADGYGIPSQAKEAVAFAFLAHQTLAGQPGNLPSVTGARQPVILGKICPALPAPPAAAQTAENKNSTI